MRRSGDRRKTSHQPFTWTGLFLTMRHTGFITTVAIVLCARVGRRPPGLQPGILRGVGRSTQFWVQHALALVSSIACVRVLRVPQVSQNCTL